MQSGHGPILAPSVSTGLVVRDRPRKRELQRGSGAQGRGDRGPIALCYPTNEDWDAMGGYSRLVPFGRANSQPIPERRRKTRCPWSAYRAVADKRVLRVR